MAAVNAGAPSFAQIAAKGAGNERMDAATGKKDDVRLSNIIAAKSVADTIRTSLGPRGMDKMIVEANDEVLLSNDGATIMSRISLTHPCAKMLVELSKAQDIEAGDGTTSVVVLAGAFLRAVENLLHRGIHPTAIAESFLLASKKAAEVLEEVAIKVDITDRNTLLRAAITSLSSKFVAGQSQQLAPLAVDAVLAVYQPPHAAIGAAPVIVGPENGSAIVDLNNIRVVQAIGGTVEDTEVIHGLVFKLKSSQPLGSGRITNAKVALIQFQLSPPKTDMESQVVVSDYSSMDKVLMEEKRYLLTLCKKIRDAGCNVLLIQKSILRDAVTDLSVHMLQQMKIMMIKDVEREDVPFICQTLGCQPIAHIDNLTADKFGSAQLVEESSYGDGRLVKMSGCSGTGTQTVLLRGSNQLVLDEAERSFHDALCVVRCLLKRPMMLAGGSAPEVELGLRLNTYAETLDGFQALCVRRYAEAFETIPFTLAENAGLRAMTIVTELRARHRAGEKYDGVNVRKGCVSDMKAENVLQPLLVTLSAVKLATELAMTILKIDDIVPTR